MTKVSHLLAAFLIAATAASPAFADGKKGPSKVKAPPIAPLHQQAPLPPPLPLPPPVAPFAPPPAPTTISLPSNFGTGGVGIDINGGFAGGGRVFIASGASAQSSAVAFAFASASAFAFAGGGSHGGGHSGGGGGCGCGHK